MLPASSMDSGCHQSIRRDPGHLEEERLVLFVMLATGRKWGPSDTPEKVSTKRWTPSDQANPPLQKLQVNA